MTAGGIAWDVEEACIAGFPALREAVCRGWLVRFSGNTRRTANSATPLRLDFAAPDGVIAACEALYRRQGQTAIFRIPSFLDPAMDEGLAARGYTAEAETCVIRGGIDAVAAAGDAGGVELAPGRAPAGSPGWGGCKITRRGSSMRMGASSAR